MSSPPAAPSRAGARRLLTQVLWVGIADALLLLVLVVFVDRSDSAVSIIGPIHGVGFLLLLAMTAAGAQRRYWGWWFPALVVVTGGPIGSLAGEVVVRRGCGRRRLAVVPEHVVHPGLLGGWWFSRPPDPRRTPVKLHANAALSLRQRLRAAERVVEQNWTIRSAARAAE
jgi:hypothetical protein